MNEIHSIMNMWQVDHNAFTHRRLDFSGSRGKDRLENYFVLYDIDNQRPKAAQIQDVETIRPTDGAQFFYRAIGFMVL